MNPACDTGVVCATGAVGGTPAPVGPADGTVGALAPVAWPSCGLPPRLRCGTTWAPDGTCDCASCGFWATAAAVFATVCAGDGTANAAGVCWCASQLSNSSGATTKVRKRMFACDAPQYSTQKPLYAVDPAESGVNQM